MIFKTLRNHQWKAFRRHPMFDSNILLEIYKYSVFGLFGFWLLIFGFVLFNILSEQGAYNNAIDSFNYILLYLLLFDFTFKYMLKQSQSMQIVTYLTLPIKRKTLIKFLILKELSDIWNLYFLLPLIPFVFKAILPHYGYMSAFLYLLFFYLLCIGNSFLVNIANNLLKRNRWLLFLPFMIVAAIVGITFIPGVYIEDNVVKVVSYILEKNILIWAMVCTVFAVIWRVYLSMMDADIYRAMQGKQLSTAGMSLNIPFFGRLGKIGALMNLEMKMILRSKRLRPQLIFGLYFFVFYIYMVIYSDFKESYYFRLFFTMYGIAAIGVLMAQLIFTTESSYFDGLMARKSSLLDMLKGKYYLYVSFSGLILIVITVFVFLGKLDFLFLISVFFFSIGVVFFVIFQNAVYNKNYLNHVESGWFNWKDNTSNMALLMALYMMALFALVMMVNTIFNETVANYFMLVTGLFFTVTANYWLKWIYSRFLKRKYKNMEGFRIET